MQIKLKQIIGELKHHAPFTASATLIAVFIVFLMVYFLKIVISEEIFHSFHYLHIVASAMVTAGVFYKYKSRALLAVLRGMLGAIIVGSISDVIFPYLGWASLGLDIHFHLPLLEETGSVLFFALLGSLGGVFIKTTRYPHFIHVFLSVFASFFYLLAFSSFGLGYFAVSFFVVFIAVIVPCCLSDIVFPFLFLPNKKD